MMKRVFSYHSSGQGEHYENKQGILFCSDQRFGPAAAAFVATSGFQKADPIVLPGAANILVNPKDPRDREFVLDAIQNLQRLHHFTEFYLSVHNECGGCGGIADLAFYEDVLRHAVPIVKNRMPDLVVKPILFNFDGVYAIE
jgi:hypothetical protein